MFPLACPIKSNLSYSSLSEVLFHAYSQCDLRTSLLGYLNGLFDGNLLFFKTTAKNRKKLFPAASRVGDAISILIYTAMMEPTQAKSAITKYGIVSCCCCACVNITLMVIGYNFAKLRFTTVVCVCVCVCV